MKLLKNEELTTDQLLKKEYVEKKHGGSITVYGYGSLYRVVGSGCDCTETTFERAIDLVDDMLVQKCGGYLVDTANNIYWNGQYVDLIRSTSTKYGIDLTVFTRNGVFIFCWDGIVCVKPMFFDGVTAYVDDATKRFKTRTPGTLGTCPIKLMVEEEIPEWYLKVKKHIEEKYLLPVCVYWEEPGMSTRVQVACGDCRVSDDDMGVALRMLDDLLVGCFGGYILDTSKNDFGSGEVCPKIYSTYMSHGVNLKVFMRNGKYVFCFVRKVYVCDDIDLGVNVYIEHCKGGSRPDGGPVSNSIIGAELKARVAITPEMLSKIGGVNRKGDFKRRCVNTIDDQNIYKMAVQKWGEQSQIMMCIEEMAELTQALNKLMRYGIKKPHAGMSTDDILRYHQACSELADVSIMVKQMNEILDKEMVDIAEERKVERLKGLLMGGDDEAA